MPHHLCPVCRNPGRMLPAVSPDAMATYYRCDTCGRVWTHRNELRSPRQRRSPCRPKFSDWQRWRSRRRWCHVKARVRHSDPEPRIRTTTARHLDRLLETRQVSLPSPAPQKKRRARQSLRRMRYAGNGAAVQAARIEGGSMRTPRDLHTTGYLVRTRHAHRGDRHNGHAARAQSVSSPSARPGRREATRLETGEHVRTIRRWRSLMAPHQIRIDDAASAVLSLMKDRSGGGVFQSTMRARSLTRSTLIEVGVKGSTAGERSERTP